MGLSHRYTWARQFLQRMSPSGRDELLTICRKIELAEKQLQLASVKIMQDCLSRCEGICCRNLDVRAIIGRYDFLLLATLHPELDARMTHHLAAEDPIFTQNCIFLTNGEGPCIFPEHARPQVCLTTFCQSERPIKNELQQVHQSFRQLQRFVFGKQLSRYWQVLWQKH